MLSRKSVHTIVDRAIDEGDYVVLLRRNQMEAITEMVDSANSIDGSRIVTMQLPLRQWCTISGALACMVLYYPTRPLVDGRGLIQCDEDRKEDSTDVAMG